MRQPWPGFILGGLVLIGLIGGGRLLFRQERVTTRPFDDPATGIHVDLPAGYRQVSKSDQTTDSSDISSGSQLVANFERTDPAGYLTIRIESGLRKVTNLLHRSLLDHVSSEIAQYFLVRYRSYESLETKRLEVQSQPALTHQFRYRLDNGTQIHAQLLVVPRDDDTAAYFILQAEEDDWPKIASDFAVISQSVILSQPSN